MGRVESTGEVRPNQCDYNDARPRTFSFIFPSPVRRYTAGLSVVSHTLCKMDVLPAFARPIMSTLNLISGTRRPGLECSFPIFVGLGIGKQVDLIPLNHRFDTFSFL